jgi:hypothetical protein
LLAPNDKPSNLPERLYAQVRTKEFKDWFGDWINDPKNASKVVDENGEPRVVYHGSNQYGFDVFDPSHSDDKISLFAAGSKYIASTYRSNRYLQDVNVKKALLDGGAIELIRKKNWDGLKRLLNDIIVLPQSRSSKYGMLKFGGFNERGLEKIRNIQK